MVLVAYYCTKVSIFAGGLEMSEPLSQSVALPAADTSLEPPRPLVSGPLLSARKAVRNLAIFKKVEIEKLTHQEVARFYKMTRGRVSQIVQQVRMDLAKAHSDDTEIQNHLARQRLERQLEKMRYQYALDAAATAIRRDPPTLVTNRAGASNKGGQQQSWSETINRDKPANVQLLKTYVRVTRELGQLNEREIANNPIDAQKMAVADALENWCDEAPSSPDPPSEAFLECVDQFLDILLIWLRRRRYGSSSADAWPPPPPPAPEQQPHSTRATQSETNASETNASEPNHDDAKTNHDTSEINHHPSEINVGLTSPAHFSDSLTPPTQTA
jgi:hypothetical protein